MLTKLEPLQSIFGSRIIQQAALARYTAARIGGTADVLLIVETKAELAQAAQILWASDMPFCILGGGSNVLVSDQGVREPVLINRARAVRFEADQTPPQVWAESGANIGLIARQAAARGLGGFEWAAGIPGTIGGAIVGNAGAHEGDMAGDLIVAEILQQNQTPVLWTAEQLGMQYRSSRLKKQASEAIVLSAWIRLEQKPVSEIEAKMNRFLEHRRRTQPPGASMGSMFKNPPGDYAGRLIEAAGLKGTRMGDAEISPRHGNFFINHGHATAKEVKGLIDLALEVVYRQFGIQLELEIELIGEW
jgi:UDP-N-acetylmuramate dehydrogenase